MKELPLFLSNPKDKAIVNPEFYIEYCKRSQKIREIRIDKDCIICFSENLIEIAKKICKTKKAKRWLYKTNPLYYLRYRGKKISLIVSSIGSAFTAALLEEMIALGAKNILLIGSAGSLQEHIKHGTFIIPTKAIRDEGTSYHYKNPGKYCYASKKLINLIESSFKGMNIKIVKGATWTTDAPYRETIKKFKKYRKEGVLSVEMELSALFAVAEFRKVNMAAILLLSDLLTEAGWKPQFYTKEYQNRRKDLLMIALETLRKI